MDELAVTVVDADGVARVAVSGELTGLTARRLNASVDGLADSPSVRIELDLAAVSIIDSAGIQCLINVRTRANNGGRALKIVAMSYRVERVLQVSGVLALLVDEDV
jgi:anti-anti-sigma factor